MQHVKDKAISAKQASMALGYMGIDEKNTVLQSIADALRANTNDILAANKVDLNNGAKNGTSKSMLDRLALSEERIEGMALGLEKVIGLEDPIGEVVSTIKRPNGLTIGKKRVPFGVIGIIYEARPNVTSDAMGLCIKTGNAVVLRGGSDAINSNAAIVKVAQAAAYSAGLPNGAIQLIEDTSREAATYMMKLNGLIDVLIPRGGAGLIQSIVKNATVPVIETGVGNCHVFVDESADLKMGADIIYYAKTSRPSVCNSAETLLVHEAVAEKFLPMMADKLAEVELRGCDKTRAIIDVKAATEEDYYTEFNDFILAVKVVGSVDEAIDHINKYSTSHSEAIVTYCYDNSEKFLERVDSAAVYVNASTRFTDGEEFGFGAEIGISTQKLHARGPMGLKELTTYKYIIRGSGQLR
ncbi:MAG: glutamate-5-semialdehyde dehydrogenase [Clostridia bacterium]|jgi:glutamate-5-semialdehyde dehydrogenase|nr:glutamate-5-semialdehyde dehydrogenase [Clostridia bacterium]